MTELVTEQTSRVYAVIPVFNRVKETLGCIDCLKQQTYDTVITIVVDGGSTDGTPEIIREQYPDAVVLTSERTLWWGGATRLGIEWALANGATKHDFILMVNNDTRFEPDLIEHLVESSQRHEAVVGGVVVDAGAPDQVIDGGINLDWHRYRFYTVKEIPEDIPIKLDCDVLPGRSTLVPVWAIHIAGNVDDEHFPHYIADYEFTHRLKRTAGLRLAVDYRAKVRTRVDKSSARDEKTTIRDAFEYMTSRRSKSNFMDHLHFVRKHAPETYRLRLTLRLLVAPLVSPAHKTSKILQPVIIQFRRTYQLFFGTYLVSETACKHYSLCPNELCARRVLTPSPYKGYFRFSMRFRDIRQQAPEVLPLYWWAWRPDVKLREYRTIHSGNKQVARRPD